MAIYSGFSHEEWWFSIVMLVYQMICWFTLCVKCCEHIFLAQPDDESLTVPRCPASAQHHFRLHQWWDERCSDPGPSQNRCIHHTCRVSRETGLEVENLTYLESYDRFPLEGVVSQVLSVLGPLLCIGGFQVSFRANSGEIITIVFNLHGRSWEPSNNFRVLSVL